MKSLFSNFLTFQNETQTRALSMIPTVEITFLDNDGEFWTMS